MVESGLTGLFHRVYYLIKLSLYFWGVALTGLIIFGVTPALMAMIEIHKEAQWDYQEIYWKEVWSSYKSYFKTGFMLLLFFGSLGTLLVWNLFLSVQFTGLLFLIIDFLLVVFLLLTVLSFVICTAFFTTFDISFWNGIKLAFLQIFISPKDSFAVFFGLLVISLITYQFLGLILFLSVGGIVILVQNSTQKMSQKLIINEE